jgi:hypothetical protein
MNIMYVTCNKAIFYKKIAVNLESSKTRAYKDESFILQNLKKRKGKIKIPDFFHLGISIPLPPPSACERVPTQHANISLH